MLIYRVESLSFSILEIAVSLSVLLKIMLDIGRGMSYLHGLANTFRPQFVLNSDHVTVI